MQRLMEYQRYKCKGNGHDAISPEDLYRAKAFDKTLGSRSPKYNEHQRKYYAEHKEEIAARKKKRAAEKRAKESDNEV